jgi:hypothetical protein
MLLNAVAMLQIHLQASWWWETCMPMSERSVGVLRIGHPGRDRKRLSGIQSDLRAVEPSVAMGLLLD